MNAGTETPGAAPVEAWPRWQRWLFRFAACYCLLYTLPSPFAEPLEALGELAGWSWPGTAIAAWEQGTRDLTTWMDAHGLAPWPVVHQRTGSGDTAHAWTRLLATAVLSAVLAGLWSACARLLPGGWRAHPRLARWLHLLVRWDLAFWMLGYGFAKLYQGQFGELELDRLTTEVGDLRPMTMVGTFMAANRPYEVFGGVAEVLGGLLLFHRRTALLGAFVTIAVMTNVCALNWLCGVPVKQFSAHMLLFAIGLLAPYARQLRCVFWRGGGDVPRVDLAVVRPRWARALLTLVGTGWVGTLLVAGWISAHAASPFAARMQKPELYGLYVVQSMARDGAAVPATDATRWRYLAIDRGGTAWLRAVDGSRQVLRLHWDPATGVAQVWEPLASATARGVGAGAVVGSRVGVEAGGTVPWTIAAETRTVPVEVPLLLTAVDRGRRVDGQRRGLTVTGTWRGQRFEVQAIGKVFPLQTGFRLRQELPDFW